MRPHGIANRLRGTATRSRDIRLLLDRILDVEGEARPIDVGFVGTRRMAALHERCMGLAGPTDVLSFPMGDPAPGAPPTATPLGDLIICIEVCRRSASQRGIDLHAEVARMLIHGTLHLLGHDHRGRKEMAAMRRKEDLHMRWYRRSGLRVVG